MGYNDKAKKAGWSYKQTKVHRNPSFVTLIPIASPVTIEVPSGNVDH